MLLHRAFTPSHTALLRPGNAVQAGVGGAATNYECEGLPQDEIVFTNVGCFQRVVGMQVVSVLDAPSSRKQHRGT